MWWRFTLHIHFYCSLLPGGHLPIYSGLLFGVNHCSNQVRLRNVGRNYNMFANPQRTIIWKKTIHSKTEYISYGIYCTYIWPYVDSLSRHRMAGRLVNTKRSRGSRKKGIKTSPMCWPSQRWTHIDTNMSLRYYNAWNLHPTASLLDRENDLMNTTKHMYV